MASFSAAPASLSLCCFICKVINNGQCLSISQGDGKVSNEGRRKKMARKKATAQNVRNRVFDEGRPVQLLLLRKHVQCFGFLPANSNRAGKKPLTTRCLCLCTNAHFLYVIYLTSLTFKQCKQVIYEHVIGSR